MTTATRKPAKKAARAPLLAKALESASMSTATEDLLTKPGAWQPGETSALQYLALDDVQPAADNPRANLGDLSNLATSITAVGILEPILVRINPLVSKKGPGYQIVAGHRRHAAAKIAGLELIPCIVRAFTEQARIEAMVIENLQRTDLSPFDEARGLTQLVNLGLTQRDIAERVGCSQSHVSKRLALAAMPPAAEQLFVAESMTIQQVEELAKVPDVDQSTVVDELVTRAAAAKDSLLPSWAISDTINQLKRKRKHAEAEKVGIASGLKRLTDRPYDSPGGSHRVCKKADATHWYLHQREANIQWARTQAAHNKATPKVEQPPSVWELRHRAGERIDQFIVDSIVPAVIGMVERAVFIAEITTLARQALDAEGDPGRRRRQSIHIQSLDYDLTELVGVDDALYLAIAMLFDLPSAIWDLPILEFFIRHGYRTTGLGETFPDGFDPTPILIVDPVPEPTAS